MNERTRAILCLGYLAQLAISPQADAAPNLDNDPAAEQVLIRATSHQLKESTVEVHYEIRNGTQQDVWICDSVSGTNTSEVFLGEEDQTLLVRKRLDVASSIMWDVQPFGKYVRIPSGGNRNESLLLTTPVSPIYEYGSRTAEDSLANATRLTIEIGYYAGSLPQVFLGMLVLQRYISSSKPKRPVDDTSVNNHISGGYRHGCQDYYENQTGIDTIPASV